MLKIELPFPASELMPNRKNGRHFGSTHAAKKTAFDAGYYATYQAVQQHKGLWQPVDGCVAVPIVLTFHAPDNKRARADLDNLLAASKAALDGVAAALLMDDREFEPVTLKRGEVRKAGALVVEVGA